MNIIVLSTLSKSGNLVSGNTIKANGAAQLIDSGHAEKWNTLSIKIILGG